MAKTRWPRRLKRPVRKVAETQRVAVNLSKLPPCALKNSGEFEEVDVSGDVEVENSLVNHLDLIRARRKTMTLMTRPVNYGAALRRMKERPTVDEDFETVDFISLHRRKKWTIRLNLENNGSLSTRWLSVRDLSIRNFFPSNNGGTSLSRLTLIWKFRKFIYTERPS